MIDGITIKYRINNFDTWKQSVNISFGFTVADTGEILTKKRYDDIIITHRAKWEKFDLTVKEVLNIPTGKKVYYLTIKGSLHKNEYAGTNYLPFTWQQLQQQVNHLCTTLSIRPTDAQISSLEVGVNIVTPFIVTPFLRHNVISYKGHSFNHYKADITGFILGIYSNLTQYEIKIYDKGKQNDLPLNLMRFEKRFLKMQELNKHGIKYLADLLTYKVFKLLPMLLDAWQNVLIYDIENIIPDIVSKNDLELLTAGQNPKYWEKLKTKDKRMFNYHRQKFRKLVSEYGNNWQQLVKGLIENEWYKLFKNCSNLPTGKNEELYNITIKINGKNIQNRYCHSCGRDITNQKEGSLFCSAKYVGESAAKKCRNNDSNRRNNRVRKIDRINKRGVLFDIEPFIIERKLNKFNPMKLYFESLPPTLKNGI